MATARDRGTRAARARRRREQTRREIIDVARRVILEVGPTDFTLAAVADALELTKPALYYYFASKRALLVSLFQAEWFEAAHEVAAAVEATASGADAIEALMRTFFDRYRDRIDLFALIHQRSTVADVAPIERSELDQLRPVNDLLYGGAEERLRADQRAGLTPCALDPRRFAFTAHTSVVGLLGMKAIVEGADDMLIHRDDDLIDELCTTYRAAARPQEHP